MLTLGLAGSLLGVALARAGDRAPIPLRARRRRRRVAAGGGRTTASPGAPRLQGLGIGVLVSLLFSVVPLLQVRFVKPSLLLRDETRGAARDWTRVGAVVLVSAGARRR